MICDFKHLDYNNTFLILVKMKENLSESSSNSSSSMNERESIGLDEKKIESEAIDQKPE